MYNFYMIFFNFILIFCQGDKKPIEVCSSDSLKELVLNLVLVFLTQ